MGVMFKGKWLLAWPLRGRDSGVVTWVPSFENRSLFELLRYRGDNDSISKTLDNPPRTCVYLRVPGVWPDSA